MSDVPELVELSAAGLTLTFDGGNGVDPKDDVLLISEDGVEGWYDSPDDKTVMSERGQGDGAHDVWESDFLYSARVITMHFTVGAHDRIGAVRLLNDVRRVCAHRRVRFRLKDATHDCYITGRASWKSNGEYGRDGWLGGNTLTVTCERPEILSSAVRGFQLLPSVDSAHVGLSYGGSNKGLAYPLSYGVAAADARNVGLIVNGGSSRAYPTFTCQGPWPDGVQITFPGLGLLLDYSQPVHDVPLVLDSRSRTASIGGLDVSRNLRSRGFPTVPAGGSVSVNLQSVGSGHITVETRDTYM